MQVQDDAVKLLNMAQDAYRRGDYEQAVLFAKYSYFNHVDGSKLEDGVYALDERLARQLAQQYESLVKGLQQPKNEGAVEVALAAVKASLVTAVAKITAGS